MLTTVTAILNMRVPLVQVAFRVSNIVPESDHWDCSLTGNNTQVVPAASGRCGAPRDLRVRAARRPAPDQAGPCYVDGARR